MNIALRAVHDALAGDEAVSDRWRSLVSQLAGGVSADAPLDSCELQVAVRRTGIRGSVADWYSNLRHLGVLDARGAFDHDRAEEVGVALEIAADSFTTSEVEETWTPVATLPAELRPILRPRPVRQTAGIFLEIIDDASRELRLAAPFVDRHAADFITDALIAAGSRNVDVTILTSVDHARSFSELGRRWTAECSGALQVFEITTDLSTLGSHAKVLIADTRRAYVGSANLTSAGLGRQIEIGVEVRGPQTAALANLLLDLERLGTRVGAVPRRWVLARRD